MRHDTHKHYKSSYKAKQKPLFSSIPEESTSIINNFDLILQNIKPLGSKQLQSLPFAIKTLSHQLTDERSSRHLSYMNQTIALTAYTRYFMWWNLVRLTHLFAGLSSNAFNSLKDHDYCLDLGSGPLTVPIALWLARPELRDRKLTFYCVDLSTTALSLGEEIFLSIIATINRKTNKTIEPWQITRIKGSTDVKLKNAVSAVFCANFFNELFWDSRKPLEEDTKKYSTILRHFIKSDSLIMVIEPGIPRSARFISLLRDTFIQNNFSIIAPCTHTKSCPMNGERNSKWCHFVLSTENAPKKLQKLSATAGLSKDRATISFILAHNKIETHKSQQTFLRVVSDPVKIPGKGTGRYACAPWGLTLMMEPPISFSGNLVSLNITTGEIYHLPIDKKTGAKVLYPNKKGKTYS